LVVSIDSALSYVLDACLVKNGRVLLDRVVFVGCQISGGMLVGSLGESLSEQFSKVVLFVFVLWRRVFEIEETESGV